MSLAKKFQQAPLPLLEGRGRVLIASERHPHPELCLVLCLPLGLQGALARNAFRTLADPSVRMPWKAPECTSQAKSSQKA